MSTTTKKFNLNYIDQISYLEGFHRSGWPYVLRNLMKLQNDNGVYCDTYVDRTFLWAQSVENIIPYTKPWVGFIHHTFNTKFSDYNNENLLKEDRFLQSLSQCKGIYVFSKVQKDKWIRRLNKMGYNIPVQSFIHPTEFVEDGKKFTINKFKSNPDKMLIQVGAWLRDNYSIYRLNGGKATFRMENGQIVHKAALIGPKMQQYYKPIDFFRLFRKHSWKNPELTPLTDYAATFKVEQDGTDNDLSVNAVLPEKVFESYGDGVAGDGDEMCRDGICRDIFCRDSDYALNKYVIGAVDFLKLLDSSVISVPTLSDEEYDTLLSENVVFLKLVDAAAVNTLQECIVRSTPIVINPLPAVVEVLGSEYPLYYNDLSEVPGLVTLENITAAYNYLEQMDKSALSMNTFMSDLINGGVYSNL